MMPQAHEGPKDLGRALGFGRRIGSRGVRWLFVCFCREVSRFPGSLKLEIAPFEVRFSDSHGFLVVLSPLSELFLVSIGPSRSFDVRVSSLESFCTALDAALRHFLEAQGRSPAASRPPD
jgi:hypothetical protein